MSSPPARSRAAPPAAPALHICLVLVATTLVLSAWAPACVHAFAPSDLSNFQGNWACAEGVKLARVSSVVDPVVAVSHAVQQATRVKATGLG